MTNWSIEEDRILAECWRLGESASKISERLPGRNRNACIGRIHRLGLPYRKTQVRTRCSQVAWARKNDKEHAAKWKSARREATIDTKPAPKPKLQVSRPSETPAIEKLKAMASIMRETEAPSKGIDLLDLKEWHCRWPCGDPREEDFHFCGEQKRNGSPYCDEHHERAFEGKSRKPVYLPKGLAA
jgi:GcrA cell cycle regulator